MGWDGMGWDGPWWAVGRGGSGWSVVGGQWSFHLFHLTRKIPAKWGVSASEKLDWDGDQLGERCDWLCLGAWLVGRVLPNPPWSSRAATVFRLEGRGGLA